MQERRDTAQRRKVLANAVSVLNHALQQLQLIPRELEAHAASSLEGDEGVSGKSRLAAPRRNDVALSTDAGSVAAQSMQMYRSLALSSVGHPGALD
jgi:hypothetical protein